MKQQSLFHSSIKEQELAKLRILRDEFAQRAKDNQRRQQALDNARRQEDWDDIKSYCTPLKKHRL